MQHPQAANGTEGWCPAEFLEKVGTAPSARGRSASSVSAKSNGAFDHAPEPTLDEGRWVRAVYDNDGEGEGEISFREGDEIWQTEESDEYGWCRGVVQGVEGIYPATYVEPM